jgi:hypothetical protein
VISGREHLQAANLDRCPVKASGGVADENESEAPPAQFVQRVERSPWQAHPRVHPKQVVDLLPIDTGTAAGRDGQGLARSGKESFQRVDLGHDLAPLDPVHDRCRYPGTARQLGLRQAGAVASDPEGSSGVDTSICIARR